MADLGAIGIKHTSESQRLIPLSYTTATGTARTLLSPLARIIYDVSDARSTKNFPRAFVSDHSRVEFGRVARYLDQFMQVRGTVKNSAGTGISRRVIIVNRYGRCVGVGQSAGDGTFSILVDNQTGYVLVCAIPDDTDNRNAVVAWKVTPVTAL